MKFIIRLFLSALTLLLVTYLIPGIHVDTLVTALVAAFFLGVLNAVVRPILVFLTLPITLLTLGLFIFVINAFLFLVVATFIDGFTVDSFWYALLGSVLVSIVSSVTHRLTK